MRRFLYFLGALALIAIVVAGIGIGVAVYEGRGLDAQSRAFVDRAVPAITAHWDKEQLLDRASPRLRQSLRPGQLTAFFVTLSRLGPLVKYEGAKGQATMSYNIGTGGNVSAKYTAKALYRHGEATIYLVLVKRADHWLIRDFHVERQPNGQP